MVSTAPAPKSIFLNVPFDPPYQPLFATLVGTLICLGQTPRSVLEIPETGQGRLARIYQLLRACDVSLHDLSRQGRPPRLNMPFELGLACSLRLSGTPHEIVVLDSVRHRLLQTLSDYRGPDPSIHQNRCVDLISCLLDVFQVDDEPSPSDMRAEGRYFRKLARVIARTYRRPTIFHRAAFLVFIAAATQRAQDQGFIRP